MSTLERVKRLREGVALDPQEFRALMLEVMAPLQGWCWEEKAVALCDAIQAAPNSNGPLTLVEIGVYGGKSLVPQALALQQRRALTGAQGHIWGIDPWTTKAALEGFNDPANAAWWNALDIGRIYAGCATALANCGLMDCVSLLKANSQEVSGLFSWIDLLHIDGNHSETASRRDVALYLPMVRPGGVICLDDTNWATNKAALDDVSAQCDLLEIITRPGCECRLFRKRCAE
jgi:hypothetical protein